MSQRIGEVEQIGLHYATGLVVFWQQGDSLAFWGQPQNGWITAPYSSSFSVAKLGIAGQLMQFTVEAIGAEAHRMLLVLKTGITIQCRIISRTTSQIEMAEYAPSGKPQLIGVQDCTIHPDDRFVLYMS